MEKHVIMEESKVAFTVKYNLGTNALESLHQSARREQENVEIRSDSSMSNVMMVT